MARLDTPGDVGNLANINLKGCGKNNTNNYY